MFLIALGIIAAQALVARPASASSFTYTVPAANVLASGTYNVTLTNSGGTGWTVAWANWIGPTC